MALKSPLMPSPTGPLSAFSPYSDSPNSPVPFPSSFHHHHHHPQSNRSSGPSDSLAPPPSPYPQQIEPSPVDSNGTEGTDIEEDAQDLGDLKSPLSAVGDGEKSPGEFDITSPQSTGSERVQKINTQLPARTRSDSADNDPQSVIHIPSGFKNLEGPRASGVSPPRANLSIQSPSTPEAARGATVSPVNTDVPRVTDRATPRAQTMQELEDEWKRKSRRSSSLEDIPESHDKEENEVDSSPSTAENIGRPSSVQYADVSDQAHEQIEALRTALSECWTLCNTLANLSSSHRQRTFKFAGQQQVQEQAWRSCWRLCQQLYENRDQDHSSQVLPTLELCRDFCQCLFEARTKHDEAADSVLRVSFELNNHLYNTHDRALPEPFNERTLDFYITLCHRLMRQRTSLPQETDALLRACWSLAENLFNLRQNQREGKALDEDLLGSAVQACWELCDLFREGWTQIRPDRGTPRPNQTKFSAPSTIYSSSSRSDVRSNSSLSNRAYQDASTLPPETPTTIFDDTASATDSPDSTNVPNILVLGPASKNGRSAAHHERWSSNASVLSGYSESASSQRTSSTQTAGKEDQHLMRLKYLLLKAGMDTGFQRMNGQQLPQFVNGLPANAFGTMPWQVKVLTIYKKLVSNDRSMLQAHNLPSRRLGAVEVANSVNWLGNAESWAWMRDLYRLVFGFGIDEAERRGGHFQV
ncbi:hypothetical protein K431DRAFT_307923 [Polychaeton citri CBS 116435]|uniref:DUF7624 domain-containing protein n=1 Tax=Polychaeton citri CBS 116435 TaxID=1314669 RepID=A0A9P4UJE1_9PEZI|nr:hypothetical protein K431DRAFT_307923 [Polychaeton citri CBS 116435]